MRKIVTALIALACCLAPAAASGFFAWEDGSASVTARAAVDLTATFMGNNGPRVLYPEPSEGIAAAGLRLLVNATLLDRVRIDLNAYQDLDAATVGRSFMTSTVPTAYRSTYLDRDWGGAGGKISAPLAVDALSLKLFLGPADLTVGRQPVGLSTTFIFTPNDLFHPFSAGAADTAFRPGVDAARLDWRLGALGSLTAVGVMGYDFDDRPAWHHSAALGRASVNAAGFDWSVLGGKTDGRSLAGGAIAGEIWRLGVRAEGNVSFPTRRGADPYAQVAGGLDYRWESSLHLMVEYYYHQNGGTDPIGYLTQLGGRDLTVDPYLGRHYLGAMLSGKPTPLLLLQGAVVANLSDPSAYAIPALVYNAASEVDFILYGTIPIGRYPSRTEYPELNSEFGLYPYSATLLSRMYF